MFILDTDHLSLLDRNTIEGFNLGRRLATIPSAAIFITIITYEEQMRGWLDYIARANTMPRQIEAYQKLYRYVESFRNTQFLVFDALAAVEYERLGRPVSASAPWI